MDPWRRRHCRFAWQRRELATVERGRFAESVSTARPRPQHILMRLHPCCQVVALNGSRAGSVWLARSGSVLRTRILCVLETAPGDKAAGRFAAAFATPSRTIGRLSATAGRRTTSRQLSKPSRPTKSRPLRSTGGPRDGSRAAGKSGPCVKPHLPGVLFVGLGLLVSRRDQFWAARSLSRPNRSDFSIPPISRKRSSSSRCEACCRK